MTGLDILLSKYSGHYFMFKNKVTDDIIAQAEKKLHLNLNNKLKYFIKKYGALSVGHIEIFGLGMPESSHLNIITRTIDLRRETNFPQDAVVIEDLGDGHYALCDVKGKIYEWAFPNYYGKIKIISDNFENYVKKKIESVF